MYKKSLAVLGIAIVMLFCTACGQQRSAVTDDGAKKVVLGIGKGVGDSKEYVDTDAPSPTPTPSPEITEAVPTITEGPTPTADPTITHTVDPSGTFTEDDCAVIVAGVTIRPGMDFTGKEESLGKIIEKLEGVSCLQIGYDVNYYYKGYHIDTVTIDGKQYVYSATFSDVGAATAKGIGVGSTEEDVIAAYGDPHEQTMAGLVYVVGKKRITFLAANDRVTEILLADSSFQ
ncbi:MAG: hypothetical protein J5872_01360 [Lachnospiraceae bacterium]|nr:hypothetical protein [Lachnospiraceae bacterium]